VAISNEKKNEKKGPDLFFYKKQIEYVIARNKKNVIANAVWQSRMEKRGLTSFFMLNTAYED